MKFFFIFSFLFLIVKACPPGWTDGQDSNCYKLFIDNSVERDANASCVEYGGHLAMPTNVFTNSLILSMAPSSVKTLWLGIRCYGPSLTSCYYDDGTQFRERSYDNFLTGDTHNYLCVAMYSYGPYSGKWFSDYCRTPSDGYVCQIPGERKPACPPEYSQNGDSCYKAISMAQTYDDAEALCSASCGHVATPRSTAEDDYITSLVSNYSYTSDYVRLGISYYNKQYYDSNTNQPIAYRNFGYQNPNLGNCVGLSLINDVVARGKWINTYCNTPLISVCRTNVNNYPCSTTTPMPVTTPTPMPVTTPTPTHYCKSPFYYENNGTVSSPYYPNTYNGETCTYILSVPEGQQVQVVFNDIHIEYNSSYLMFYNEITDNMPFQIIDSNSPVYSVVLSDGSSMKIVTRSSAYGNNRWSFKFSSASRVCTGPFYYETNGNISSPRYPNSFFGETCTYIISVPKGQQVQVQILEKHLSGNNTIEFYNTITDMIPFKIVDGSILSNQDPIISNDESMKIIARASMRGDNQWFLNFKPYQPPTSAPSSGCNSGMLYTPGSISSPGYPVSFSKNVSCSYHLAANNNKRVLIEFTELTASYGEIVVYDGPTVNYPIIGKPVSNLIKYESSYQNMLVVFNTVKYSNFYANYRDI